MERVKLCTLSPLPQFDCLVLKLMSSFNHSLTTLREGKVTWTELCERSTIIPSLFISFITVWNYLFQIRHVQDGWPCQSRSAHRGPGCCRACPPDSSRPWTVNYKILQNIPELFQNIPEYSRIFRNIPEYSGIFDLLPGTYCSSQAKYSVTRLFTGFFLPPFGREFTAVGCSWKEVSCVMGFRQI